MPSGWKARLPRVREINDRFHGEAVRLLPMREDAYAGAVEDTDRQAVDLVAVLRVGAGGDANLNGSNEAAWSARVPVFPATLHVDTDRYPLAGTVGRGDHILALDRDQVRFEVARIDRRQRSRLVLQLTAL
jgi:hypothetical protein